MSTQLKSCSEQFKRPLKSLIPRYILLLLACISIICFAITLALSNSKTWPQDLTIGYWGQGLALVAVLPSLCWTSFCLIRRRFSSTPLHPSWLLSLDLICFLTIAACCPIGMSTSTFWSEGQECLVPTNDTSDGPVSASCERLIHLVWDLEMIAFAGAYSMAIVHFVLFVIACRATDLYNRDKKRRGKAGRQMELPAYPFNESQEPIVSISSPHELDTRISQNSKRGSAWVSEVGSGQDYDCAAEIGYGKHGLVDDSDSARKLPF